MSAVAAEIKDLVAIRLILNSNKDNSFRYLGKILNFTFFARDHKCPSIMGSGFCGLFLFLFTLRCGFGSQLTFNVLQFETPT